MRAPRLLVVADIAGPDDYHLGDEAMLEANLSTLRRLVPGVQFTLPSRDPISTASCYQAEAVPAPRFPPDLLATPDRWAREIVADPAAACSQWLGDQVAGALHRADGLLVSGGGNLCATWPEKVLERVALIELAAALGRPVAIVGQTLGPALTPAQRPLLAAALPKARWLGVRDPDSAALAVALGVPAERVHAQLDDAFSMTPAPPTEGALAALDLGARPWIVVTLDASFGADERDVTLRSLTAQLDGLAELLGAGLVFSPHVGGERVAAAWDDRVVARKAASLVRAPAVVLDLWPGRAVRWLIAQAAMVVSTRYHPLVFATAAGVPALGLYTDAYTRTKLRGALAPADLADWCLPVADAESGALLPLAAELWHLRADVQRRLRQLAEEAQPAEIERWAGILDALGLAAGATLGPVPPPRPTSPVVIASPAAPILSAEQWRAYDEHGYLRLGRVLDDAQLDALRRRLDDMMLGRVHYPTLRMQLDTGGAYEDLPEPVAEPAAATLDYRKVQGLEADPLVLGVLRHPVFREICLRHYGRHASVSIFRAMMMNKPAGQGTYLPWHQDGGNVWKLDRDPLVTSWVALDAATRANGCLQVIPGSHRLGLLSKYGSTVSAEDVAQHCPDDAVVHLELAAGEALLLHNWLLHRSDVNPTATPRRAFSACYMDGRTLSTLTGRRFPVIFGASEDVDLALPYLHCLRETNRQLYEMRAEAERYAKSLEEALARTTAAAEAAATALAAATASVATPRPRRRWPFG